jgi:signal peptidase II
MRQLYRILARITSISIILGSIVLLLGLDRLTKLWALAYTHSLSLGWGVSVYPTTNTGGAWSIGQHLGAWFGYIAIASALILSIAWLAHIIAVEKRMGSLQSIAPILIISGALGNAIDRLLYGHVIDFIAVTIITWEFPIFNLADIWIVWGCLLYVSTILVDHWLHE